MRTLLFCVALLPLAAQSNNWASVQALNSGSEVRVSTTGSKAVRGQIQSVTPDLLVLNVKNSQRMFTRQETTRVSVKQKNHRLRHTLIGFGIGTGAGLTFGAAIDAHDNDSGTFANLGKKVLTPVGAVLGLIIGVVLPTGGWFDLYRVK
jgi:hypothetical protein